MTNGFVDNQSNDSSFLLGLSGSMQWVTSERDSKEHMTSNIGNTLDRQCCILSDMCTFLMYVPKLGKNTAVIINPHCICLINYPVDRRELGAFTYP